MNIDNIDSDSSSYSSYISDSETLDDDINDNDYGMGHEKEICLKCRFYNIVDDGYCKVTWDLVMKDSSIKSIQEPISEMMIGKLDFDDAYRQFMITLDGRDITSFVDFFWRRSAVDNSCLEFIDKDTRLDIYEYLKDEELVPDMEKVHSGDWKFNK
jgi:hypothetical protein